MASIPQLNQWDKERLFEVCYQAGAEAAPEYANFYGTTFALFQRGRESGLLEAFDTLGIRPEYDLYRLDRILMEVE